MRHSAVVRAVYGVVLLFDSVDVIRKVTGEQTDGAATVGRVLGTRHLLQALTLDRTRSRRWLAIGISVDLLHALSMLALAAFGATHRRATVLDAMVAGAWAANGWRAVRRE